MVAVKQARPIVVTGSIAIDRIMGFSGSYADHLYPEKLDEVSVSIFLDNLADTHGGVAANIAYTLALLDHEPYLLGSVGPDGLLYMENLARCGVNITHVHESDLPTASFNVITDRDQNQVGGFYPGAMFDSSTLSLKSWAKTDSIVVIAPHDPGAMRIQVAECHTYGLTYCYDIGQQVSNAPAEDMKLGVEAAEILILNDYELAVLCSKIGLSDAEIKSTVPIVITTFGPNGSRIEGARIGAPINIGVAQPTAVIDPTGAGDAYRAGLLYGYARNWQIEDCAQLGAVCASFAIETFGTQTHAPSPSDIAERYAQAFGTTPPLET